MDSNDNLGADKCEEILEELAEGVLMVDTIMVVACNTHNLFNPSELHDGGQTTINHNVGVTYVLIRMREVLALVKVLTCFEVDELDACPTICNNTYNIGVERVMNGRPMKLTHEQHLLNFIIYLKHDNVIISKYSH